MRPPAVAGSQSVRAVVTALLLTHAAWGATPSPARGLAEAAQDSVLAPWQREFMIEMAAGNGAAEAGAATPSRAFSPLGTTTTDGRWTQEPPPSRRYLHTAVYDPLRHRMVVFGGYDK